MQHLSPDEVRPAQPGAVEVFDGGEKPQQWAVPASAFSSKVVPMNVPTQEPDPNAPGRWEVGLFGCCVDCVPNCMMSWCFPYISLAQVYARLGITTYRSALYRMWLLTVPFFILRLIASQSEDGTGATLVFIGFLLSEAFFAMAVSYARGRVRQRFSIQGDSFGDFCVAWCCTCCAIAQMATQSRSYKRGDCSFAGPDVLPPFPQ